MTKRESSNEQRILDGLRSGDPDRINQAYELLTENLVFYARSLLRTRFNQVNLQEGSIVQSAIASLVERGADQFDNEDHLQGRMRIEVLRKIQDRIKARSNRSLQENDSGIGLGEERVTDGPGIATRIAEGECVFDARGLMLAGLDRSDRELVDLCLFQGLDSRKAGEQLGVAPEVIRQRLTRLRPRLRASLLEPVRRRLDPKEWEILDVLVVARIDPSEAIERLGMTPSLMAEELLRLLGDVVRPMIGEEGCRVLDGLMGRSKG